MDLQLSKISGIKSSSHRSYYIIHELGLEINIRNEDVNMKLFYHNLVIDDRVWVGLVAKGTISYCMFIDVFGVLGS